MPFIGELAAVGTSLCFSFGSVFFTHATRMAGSALVNRVRLLMALVLMMLWHLLATGQLLPLDASPERWFWLGTSGLIGFVIGDAFLLQAFMLIGPRLSMLMMALAPVLGAVLAWILLGETLTLLEIAGIGVILAGIIVVIAERRGQRELAPADSRKYVIGLLCGFGGALGQAGGLILSKKGLVDDFPAVSANVMRLLVATIAIWIIAAFSRQIVSGFQTLRAKPQSLWYMIGGAILGPVIGVWLSLVAVQNTSVGVASTLSSLMPIFLIPISYFAFNERVTRQGIFGTLLAFAGMVILFL